MNYRELATTRLKRIANIVAQVRSDARAATFAWNNGLVSVVSFTLYSLETQDFTEIRTGGLEHVYLGLVARHTKSGAFILRTRGLQFVTY